MKKAIPLTGSSNGVSDLDLKRFRAALRKQLLKVAQTHPVASTRALFHKMADGNVMPRLTTEREPDTNVAPAPAELSKIPPIAPNATVKASLQEAKRSAKMKNSSLK